MKYTIKMIKIPLELYNRLISDKNMSKEDEIVSKKAGRDQNILNKKTGEIDVKRKLAQQQISAGVDEKWLRYNQEFKRFQKLLRDQSERPMNVRIQNIDEFLRSTKLNDAESKNSSAHSPPYNGNHHDDRNEDYGEEGEEYMSADEDEGSMPSIPVMEAGTSEEIAPPKNIDEILEYIKRNAKQLGVNNQDKVLHRFAGRVQPVKSSSVREIIHYQMLYGRRKQRTRAVPTPPGGYKKFAQRAAQDPMLSNIFQNIVDIGSSMQTGSGHAFTIKKTITSHSNKNFNSFKPFKPSLWNLGTRH